MKRTVLLLISLLISALALTSCDALLQEFLPGADDTGGGSTVDKDENEENLIYKFKTDPYIIFDSREVDSEKIMKLNDSFVNQSIYPRLVDISDTTYKGEVYEHEIVVGKTERDISVMAYDRLERLDKNSDADTRYCIYSDGSSIAVAYDKDLGGFTYDIVSELFEEKYICEKLVLPKGVAESDCFDLYERLGEQDIEYYTEAWAALAEELGEGSEELIRSLNSFYSIYEGEKIIRWLVGLYDMDICVCRALDGKLECEKTPYCGTGGFYYSNSARDNIGYLPDAESIAQALAIIGNCGITYGLEGHGYKAVVPEWMGKQICDYLYNMQSQNGYFYHPQWSVEFTNSHIERRARDYSWCTDVLSTYNVKPKYELPVGYSFDIPSEEKTGMLGAGSVVSAVSKVIASSDEETDPHFATLEAFKEYIDSLDLYNNSYSGGSVLSAQGNLILAMPKEYKDFLIERLNDVYYTHDNGTWHHTVDYTAINGVMKLSGTYERCEANMPDPERTCRAAFAAIISDEPVKDVVDVWNPWVAVNGVLDIIRKFGEGPAEADRVRDLLYDDIAQAINKSKEKLLMFKKDDGSFSYQKKNSSSTSSGAPVAVPNSNEGDVNATILSTNSFTLEIFMLLGPSRIPFCLTRERLVFLDAVNSLAPIVKEGLSAEIGDPIGFDWEDVGDAPSEVTVDKNGRTVIAEDPRENSEGNVLKMTTKPEGSDYFTVSASGLRKGAACQVFEGEFCFEEFSDSARLFRLEMGREGDKNNVYRIEFKSVNGRIILSETPSYSQSISPRELGITANVGEWFKLRVEYYTGDADNVRIKVYFNDALAAVTDCYYDGWEDGEPGVKLEQARMFALYDANLTLYADNIHCYNTSDTYKPEALSETYKDNTNVDSALLNSPEE